MKRWLILYVSTLLVLLPLDGAFLAAFGNKIFKSQIPEMLAPSPRVAPAILFYLVYVIGIVAFVNGPLPANWQHNLVYGALFGLVAYATFELTNMALLKHWEWGVVVPDLAWGATVTALAAAGGGLLTQWISTRL